MTDRDIIQGLILRDNDVTRDFFFTKCRPLFCSVIHRVLGHETDYDELVNEIYLYLMEDEAARLRQFQYRSSLYQWLKVLAVRFCMKKRDLLIDAARHEPLYEESEGDCTELPTRTAQGDLRRLLALMPNKRYVFVIEQLMLHDRPPEEVAEEMHITVDNLYNIRHRAMAQLSHVALRDFQAQRAFTQNKKK